MKKVFRRLLAGVICVTMIVGSQSIGVLASDLNGHLEEDSTLIEDIETNIGSNFLTEEPNKSFVNTNISDSVLLDNPSENEYNCLIDEGQMDADKYNPYDDWHIYLTIMVGEKYYLEVDNKKEVKITSDNSSVTQAILV